MFRSSVFKDGIRYPLDTRYTEDIALWLCLLDKGYCFHNLPKVLLDYRINEDTFSRRRGFKKRLVSFLLDLTICGASEILALRIGVS